MLRHFSRPTYGPNIVRREHPIKDDVFERFNSLFPSSLVGSFGFGERDSLLLDLSIEGDNNAFVVVRAELPGMDSKNLTVEVDENMLKIEANVEESDENDSDSYVIRERRVGATSRVVRLPHDIDPEETTATYKDGILEITLPKVEKSQSRHIPIK
jgi:HSP20 family molecular chaperone IbpA|tara:strand:- start:732 stop:1199 length:468 start_codon:yes stop_codon:yes gene_type:complete